MTGCNILDFGIAARKNGKRLPCEVLQAENAKLRELCKDWRRFAYDLFDEFVGEPEANDDFMVLDDRTFELGNEAGL